MNKRIKTKTKQHRPPVYSYTPSAYTAVKRRKYNFAESNAELKKMYPNTKFGDTIALLVGIGIVLTVILANY